MPLDQQRWRSSMLALTRNILHYYNEFFQMPYPYDEIDVYQFKIPLVASVLYGWYRAYAGRAFPGVARMWGGTHVGYSDISGLGEKGLVAHELGHLWWPFVTGMRNYEQDAWLSEGFAEYATGLCFEFFKEQEERGTGFKALSEEVKNEWLIGPAGGYYGVGILNLKPYEQGSLYSPGVGYQTQAYRKGPYVLHMLRNILGPELFQTLLRRFLKDFAGKQPVTPDFIDTVRKVIFEYVKGEPFKTYRENETPFAEWSQAHRDEFLRLSDFYKNLDDWFEDWYVDPGHAKIRFSWSVRKDAGSYVFTGRIKQDPKEFKMVLAPIDIRFKKDSIFRQRFVDKPDYEFQLRLPREPMEVVFDELKTLAAEVTVEAAGGAAQP
jgi:aminopeptidase N